MARLNVHSDRVQRLIVKYVVPLYLVRRNIAALTKTLNEALQSRGIEGTLHPNRLHTLLSDDVSRALNESTLDLTEQAAQIAFASDSGVGEASATALEALRKEAARLHLFSGASVEDVAERLGVPRAVGAVLLRDQAVATRSARERDSIEAPHETPDWGFQDVAVARCLEAFSRRPAARVGLILPTGAGKTLTALRVALAMLDRAGSDTATVYWVTHRRNLREQAQRELQKLVAKAPTQDSVERVISAANRIKFVMVADLATVLAQSGNTALVVIDEAHHAAAPSYRSAFGDLGKSPVLLLTATPNRPDDLPIGIDEIAFTITYRELAERRAVLTPRFLDFPVQNFDWSSDAIADLADYVIDRSTAEFTKVLVLAPRLDRVEEFYAALLTRLPGDHPLGPEDIGYVHGDGNSMHIDNEDFLARFRDKPRAILISAQLLLEGFDDPAINTVVLTYPSSSVIRLMQAAGRCVRYSPEKRAAYVVQARNDDIAYHFDQRWLYQEIDDYLRPQLLDLEYGSAKELEERATALLRSHHVEPTAASRILAAIKNIAPGETCRIFLYGLPYFGAVEFFEDQSRWGAILETQANSVMLRTLFNAFCALGADLSDPTEFLERDGSAFGVTPDFSVGSAWLELVGLLTASYFAKREVHGPSSLDLPGSRPYRPAGATTWLKYCTFSFRPAVPAALTEFLRDCHNASAIEAAYFEQPACYDLAVKVPLPLRGYEAFLLDRESSNELDSALSSLWSRLTPLEPSEQLGALASFIAASAYIGLPARLLTRVEFLIHADDRSTRTLRLAQPSIHEEP